MAQTRKGWLTPNDEGSGFLCRPLFIPADADVAFLAAVNGALNELTSPGNWEQFGSLTPDEAAAIMLDMYTQYTTEPCEGGPCAPCEMLGDPDLGVTGPIRIIRRGNGGYTEELADGVWGPPTGDYEAPPVPQRTGPGDYICLAAANAAKVYADLYEAVTDQIAIDTNEAAVFGVVFDYALLVLGTFGANQAMGHIAAAKTGFDAFIETAETLGNDVWTADFTDEFMCFLYSYATNDDGVVTFNWPEVRQAILNSFIDAGVDFNADKALLWGQVGYLMDITAADGLNAAGATTAITSPNCDECTQWCARYDLTVAQHGFAIQSFGVWSAGPGYTGQFLSTIDQRVLQVNRTFADTYIEKFRIRYSKEGGSGANQRTQIWGYKDGVNVFYDGSNPNMFGTWRDVPVNMYLDRVVMLLDSGSAPHYVAIQGWEFHGWGYNPFSSYSECL